MSSGRRAPADAAARRRIVEELDATLFVEAAAGTGKTSALVGRLVALLASGRAQLERIVAVTFTEKAAGEMKLRLRGEIEQCRSDPACRPAVRARLEEALGQLEIARIGTIHAFCADLLRERPVEAGVDPLFEVAAEDDAARLLDQAFDGWFEQVVADPPEGVRRVLRRRSTGFRRARSTPREALRAAAGRLAEHRDYPARWRREPFERDEAIDGLLVELAAVARYADAAYDPHDYLAQQLRKLQRFVDDVRLRERVRPRDYDALEADLRQLARPRTKWHWKGYGEPYGDDLSRASVTAERDALKVRLDEVLRQVEAGLAARLRDELWPVVERYERLKRREGRLDFLDLLVGARDLLARDAGVRRDLQQRFTHFFVDEFQDTDPLQAEILLLLAADDPAVADPRQARPVPGKLFVVGDPKQSIYRFRRADVALYERVKQRLLEHGAELVRLGTSFRAPGSLHRAINGAFERQMKPDIDAAQAAYVPLQPYRPEPDDQPTLVALPVPAPYVHYGRTTKYQVERSFPDAVGAFIAWLVEESGWTVTEREAPDRRVPIAPRHVCILVRRFKSFFEDVTRPYVRALEDRRIPHVLVGGRSFHEREEILAVRNVLTAIEWPDDMLSVYATLRGPLFALRDDALLAWRTRIGSLHPLRRADDDERAALGADEREVDDALGVLARLHVGRNRRPVAETLARLLAELRAHAGIAIWPTGEQALANVLHLVDRARRFERRGAASFRAFVERLEDEAERGEGQEAPIVEEGTEGVRIMTVHKAKGLEFPVVVLADPTCRAVRERPSHHVDRERGLWAEDLCGAAPLDLLENTELELGRERAEAVRLAYVAATRARDLLVVPSCGDELIEGWLEALDPAIQPARESRRAPRPAPGCPGFGTDTVLERPGRARGRAGEAVRPGLHTSAAGNQVVWWDPSVLDLGRRTAIGQRQFRLLAAEALGTAASENAAAYAAWQRQRDEACERGGRPVRRVETVTARAAGGAADGDGAVEVVEVVRPAGGRPGGARFGTLVHASLALVPLDADGAGVHEVVRAQARLVGAPDDEIAAAAQAVEAALAHPLLRAAAAASTLRREAPVLVRLDDGALVEGVVDLAFAEREAGQGAVKEPGRWTVVDFKTDRELGDRRDTYVEQVRLYARAIAAATGVPARGLLLVV